MADTDTTYYTIISVDENAGPDQPHEQTHHGVYKTRIEAEHQVSILVQEMSTNDENVHTGEAIKVYSFDRRLEKVYVRNGPDLRVVLHIKPVHIIMENIQQIKNAYYV